MQYPGRLFLDINIVNQMCIGRLKKARIVECPPTVSEKPGLGVAAVAVHRILIETSAGSCTLHVQSQGICWGRPTTSVEFDPSHMVLD